jgi:hypothetical protein
MTPRSPLLDIALCAPTRKLGSAERVRGARRSAASGPGWLRQRRVGGAGENPRPYFGLGSYPECECTKIISYCFTP